MYMGKATSQNSAICILYIKDMSEDTKLALTRTIPREYVQLS